ncbi:MAG: hypothetical protein QXN02_03170 [Ignisphaera sp.]
MAELVEEVLEIQYGRTFLHSYRAIYLKTVLVLMTLVSRALGLYVMIIVLIFNTIMLAYAGALRLYLRVLLLWLMLSSIIIAIDYLFASLSLIVFLNLLYGFTSFTSLALFFITTPPQHIRKVIGFNALSLSYLFLRLALRDVVDIVDALRARGWSIGGNPLKHVYALRAVGNSLITKINYSIDSIKARGLEE